MSFKFYTDKAKQLTGTLIQKVKFDMMVSAGSKKGPLIEMHPSHVKFPFYLRKNTSDVETFYQIFHYDSYNIDFKTEPKVIFDCGANVGLATLYFKNRYPDAKIVSVEPESSNFAILQKNTAQYKDVHCLQSGIWNKTTNLRIIDKGLGNWGFVTEETDQEDATTVKAISIDELMKKYNVDYIDILKVDIESSEKELFESGYEKWLPKVKTILIELHDGMKEGCSRSLFKAVSNYKFTMNYKGENIIIEML